MKVRFKGYEAQYNIPADSARFTIGKVYKVVKDMTQSADPHVAVRCDNGNFEPMFATEYEIVES